ncbi:MAG TPA: SDR family NAD(P)-dependent oxidoreductase, partial [Aeromicrobium sp.]|nr:SDR family NAD(P)-dependent oxidoreductase [Aeromicrobium sp.]
MPKALVKPGKPRSAVVTGAGRGIGRAIAIELMGKGYEVVVTDLDADAARLTASEIGAPLGLGL